MIGDLDQEGLLIGPSHRLLSWEGENGVDEATMAERLVAALDDGEGTEWEITLSASGPVSIRSRDDGEFTLAQRLAKIFEQDPQAPRVETFHDQKLGRARFAAGSGPRLFCRMPAVSKEEFWRRSSGRQIFPSKSTYFEPKISAGLVARPLSDLLEA